MRADQLTEAQDLVDLVDDRSSPLVAAEKACSSSELSIRRGHYADASTGMARCKEYLQHLQGNVKLAGYYHYISGFHHQMTGNYHPSIEDYEKALGLVMLDNPSPNEALLSILNNLGNVYYRMGENAKSLSIHLEVLAGRRELWGNQHPKIAATLGNIGNSYEAAGNPEAALRHHRAAETIWRSQANAFQLQLGFTLNNIGLAHMAMDELDLAHASMKEALDIKAAILGPESASYASSLTYMGRIESRMNRMESGLGRVERALEIYEHLELKDHLRYSIARGEMASILRDQGMLERALDVVNDEIERIVDRSSSVLSDLYLIQSQVHLAMRAYASAYQSAVTSIDLNTETVGAGASESILLLRDASNSSLLLDALEVKAQSLMRMAETERVFGIWHRAFDTLENLITLSNAGSLGLLSSGAREQRGNRFDDQLADFIEIGISFSEQQRDEQLNRRLLIATDMYLGGHLMSELLSMQSQDQPENSAPHDALERGATEPGVPWISLPRSGYQSLGGFHVGAGQPTALSETFRLLNGLVLPKVRSGQSIIEYVQIRDEAIAFVITSEGVSVHRLLDPARVLSRKETVLEALRARQTERFITAAADLYDVLLRPIEPLIQQDDLLIIPHDVASGIPFELLITPNDVTAWSPSLSQELPYLIRNRSISYGYSLAQLVYNADRTERTYQREFLGIAPVFDQGRASSMEETFMQGIRAGETTTAPQSLEALPGSEKEILEISELLKNRTTGGHPPEPDAVNVYLRESLTETGLKQLPLSQYRYIHFATHGYLSRTGPFQAGILLKTDPNSKDDGVLLANEIANMTIDSELVVLSSCDSAVESTWSEQSTGLAKSFLYAGSRHVVASLWPSDDAGTPVLMRTFYAYLSEGHPVDKALRAAKLDLLGQGGALANPYYWAGFIHIGAPSGLGRSAQ